MVLFLLTFSWWDYLEAQLNFHIVGGGSWSNVSTLHLWHHNSLYTPVQIFFLKRTRTLLEKDRKHGVFRDKRTIHYKPTKNLKYKDIDKPTKIIRRNEIRKGKFFNKFTFIYNWWIFSFLNPSLKLRHLELLYIYISCSG